MLSINYSFNCTTFDPKGKILQIEYAKEAVKQGQTSIGLKSKTHVVSHSSSARPSGERALGGRAPSINQIILIAILLCPSRASQSSSVSSLPQRLPSHQCCCLGLDCAQDVAQ
mmetsp:Transcript_15776/g.26635  ORF Transcript_15776/g.26635 Transcript_15776/m.26635 type:complete len:113 (-) Transcript_15776:604-942(-)